MNSKVVSLNIQDHFVTIHNKYSTQRLSLMHQTTGAFQGLEHVNRTTGVEKKKAVRYLSILLQVVVQNLRMGLLVRCQDVHEGSWGVASSSRGVDGSSASQSRGQAERSCWRASVETLLLKRL